MKIKKFIATFLALTMCLSISISGVAFASEIDAIQSTTNFSDVTERDLTYDEYIAIIAAEQNMSIEEAVQYDESVTANSGIFQPLPYATPQYAYRSVEKTYTMTRPYGYKANLCATIKLYGSGSFYDLVGVMSTSTRLVAGEGDVEWIEMSVGYDANSITNNSVFLFGSGYFKRTIDASISGGFDVPGFSYGGSIGSHTYFLSETLNMSWTYRLYT